MVRYAILGPLEVSDGARMLSVGGGRQRKLLGVLLVHANEPVSADRLIDELWGREPPPTAAKALQGLVSQLRKQLGSESLATVTGGYLLRVGLGETDAQEFEELLRQARSLDRMRALTKLQEALELWRGPALADFVYDDFARSEIERLEELRESCIERRIDLELSLGHHDDLVPELEALVREYPLRERLRRHLILALYRSGRQADALEAYRDTRVVLRDELGLEPGDELQALQKAILAHDPSLAPPARVDDPPAPRPASTRSGRGRRNPRRRLTLVAVAAGAVLLLAAAVVAAVELAGGDSSPVVVPPNSVALIDAHHNHVDSFVGVGRRPISVAAGANGVWVSNADDGTVDQLDPRTGRLVHTIGVGADVFTVAVGFASVWVAGGNDGTVIQIDPVLGQVHRTLPLADPNSLAPEPVFFVATDDRYVWATRATELVRIDPRTDQIDGHVAVGAATSLSTGSGSVWVTTMSERLVRVDARSVKVTGWSTMGSLAITAAYGSGGLWLINGSAGLGSVEYVDPNSMATTTFGTSVTYPDILATGSGSLWVGNANGVLERVDIRTGRSIATLRVGRGLSGVAADGDRIWAAVASST